MILNGVTFIQIHDGRQYSVTVSGGTLQADRFNSSGQWVPIEGSPFADGSEAVVETNTRDPQRRIRLTPGTPGMSVEWDRLLPNRTDSVSSPGGAAVDQVARDAAASAEASAANANVTASVANGSVQSAIEVRNADVIEDTGFAFFIVNLFQDRNLYVGPSELDDALGNDIDIQTTGDGRFSIVIEKGPTHTMDFTHAGWLFVGEKPDFTQPNKTFLIEGYIHSGFQVVAHANEQNPSATGGGRRRWQSYTTGLNQVTPFTTQNIDIPLATEGIITALTLPASSTIAGITINGTGDEFTLANAFEGELSYEAFLQIIGQDRTSVQVKIYADIGDGNGFIFIPGSKHDDYATRNQNEAPFATVDKIPLDVSFPAGTVLRATIATRQRAITLKEFRLNLRD